MDPDLQRQLLEALAPVVPDTLPECASHTDADADAVCADCGQFRCWRCLTYDLDSDAIRCRGCRDLRLEKARGPNYVAVAKAPLFYVALAVLFAGLCFALGLGNPDPDDLIRADAKDKWHLQRYGKYWLQQAERARKRAEAAAAKERPEEAAAWAALAAEDLGRVADYWADTPVAPDLRLGQAAMLEKAGHAAQADELLQELADEINDQHPAYLVFLYQRGKNALRAGDRRKAQADWNTVLARSADKKWGGSLHDMVGKLTEIYSRDRMAVAREARIREVCGTLVWPGDLEAKIRREAKENGLEVRKPPPKRARFDQVWELDDEEEVEDAEDKDEETQEPDKKKTTEKGKGTARRDKPRTKLQIERFEDE